MAMGVNVRLPLPTRYSANFHKQASTLVHSQLLEPATIYIYKIKGLKSIYKLIGSSH